MAAQAQLNFYNLDWTGAGVINRLEACDLLEVVADSMTKSFFDTPGKYAPVWATFFGSSLLSVGQ